MTINHSPAYEILESFCAEGPFNRSLGLTLKSLTADHAEIQFAMKPDLIGNHLQGILHGGVISSVLDMVGGAVSMSSVIAKHTDKTIEEITQFISKSCTVNLNVNFIKPGRGNDFFARAAVIRSGNKICFVQMELYNGENTLIATATGTYLVS
jgi:uncharacterized protein (TIGR00369 family)